VQKRPGDLKVTFVNFDSYKQMTDTCFSDMKQEADLQIFFFFFWPQIEIFTQKVIKMLFGTFYTNGNLKKNKSNILILVKDLIG
jgi:proteasome assembly chaperone (PAC2) family protein